MPTVIKARTASHSDVANSEPAKAHQTQLTERAFGQEVLKRLREANGGELRLRGLKEEWINVDDGVAHELSAEVVTEE
jgi:hypothetical protein